MNIKEYRDWLQRRIERAEVELRARILDEDGTARLEDDLDEMYAELDQLSDV